MTESLFALVFLITIAESPAPISRIDVYGIYPTETQCLEWKNYYLVKELAELRREFEEVFIAADCLPAERVGDKIMPPSIPQQKDGT